MLPNLVPRVLSLPPLRKYPGFGWPRDYLWQTAPHQGGLARIECESFKTDMKSKEGESLSSLFFKLRLAEKIYSHLRRFRKTTDADIPLTKYLQ